MRYNIIIQNVEVKTNHNYQKYNFEQYLVKYVSIKLFKLFCILKEIKIII